MADQPNSRASRTNLRFALREDLTGYLVSGTDRKPLRCMGVDVSRNGLGLVSLDELELNSTVILTLKELGVTLKVAWCKPDTIRKSIYHIGLESNNPAYNLIKLLEAEGLLKATPSEEPPPKAASAALTFEAIRSALATAHTTDKNILSQSGLGKITEGRLAYPINVGGRSLLVLLPKGLKPAAASTLNETDAAAQILVLEKKPSQAGNHAWVKVWPSAP